jgi:hypothetical protein
MDAIHGATRLDFGSFAGEHRMTRESLQSLSRKDLAELAKKRGVVGWQEMKKEELITRIMRRSARGNKSNRNSHESAGSSRRATAARGNRQATASGRSEALSTAKTARPARTADTTKTTVPTATQAEIESPKDFAALNGASGYTKDRVVLMVRDPYWLHVYWEITTQSLQRAEAALGQDWHTAKPILRVVDVSSQDTTSTSEAIVRDIEIHGGCQNWYIDVPQPPKSYRVDIGYLSRRGQFYVMCRSNVVTTPKAGVKESLEDGWSDLAGENANPISTRSTVGDSNSAVNQELKQLLEERLRRPLGTSGLSSFGPSAAMSEKRKFGFRLDAELIVFGETAPDARVTLQGEPVKLRPDGTFTMRFSLPDSRQIIPAVATSPDGVEERTIVLAIERNTKYLEPILHDLADVE